MSKNIYKKQDIYLFKSYTSVSFKASIYIYIYIFKLKAVKFRTV